MYCEIECIRLTMLESLWIVPEALALQIHQNMLKFIFNPRRMTRLSKFCWSFGEARLAQPVASSHNDVVIMPLQRCHVPHTLCECICKTAESAK